MIIKSITLNNIRSYEHETVEFPTGTVLLSGDIGSGKSSILLAIEFALFGILRGGLSGTDLLRHGETNGSVDLTIQIDDSDITIHRELKRSKDRVGQEAGYIVKDGRKFEGTPVELKAKIIDLIGYPQELVSRSKSLIYRYTVYTPQEMMKDIIREGSEARLDTLRKIFNIDTYKRIKENAALLGREVKSDRKVLKSKTEGLNDAKERREQKKADVEEYHEQLETIKERISDQSKKVAKRKERKEELETQAEDIRDKQQRLEVTKNKLEDAHKRKQRLEREQNKLNKKLDQIDIDLDKDYTDEIDATKEEITKYETKIEQYDDKLSQIREKEATRKEQKRRAKKTINDITDLDHCPLCDQEVDEQHRVNVIDEQEEKIADADKRLEKAQHAREKISDKRTQAKQHLRDLRQRQTKLSKHHEQQKRYKDKRERLDDITDELDELDDHVDELNERKTTLNNDIDDTILTKVDDAKEALDDAKDQLQKLEIKQTEIAKDKEAAEDTIDDINERIDEMEHAKDKLNNLNERLDWLLDTFVPTIDVIERHVMLRIYGEFNEYFTEWFNILMEDETINVRLDDDFSPVIIQDGYETTIDNLSGGEKTSVALAYRLSLNKVINDFISTIKTDDVIILDEPTDGFSTDQLDKVREVLRQLDIAQVIIVSHEPKMETYVDDIITVTKHNHVSRVENI